MLEMALGDQKMGDHWKVQSGGGVGFDVHVKASFWLVSGGQQATSAEAGRAGGKHNTPGDRYVAA